MPKQKLNNFDALRLVGALLVLVSHQFALSGRHEPPLGGFGLAIFFSVSGYLVTTSWFADPHLGRFAARRLLRIWPAMAVTVLITALLSSLFLDKTAQALTFMRVLFFDFRDGDFFLQNTYHQLDGPLYTIPWEIMCYCGVAASGLLFGRRIRWVFLIATPLAIALMFLLTGKGVVRAAIGEYRNYALLCAYFIIGSAIFHVGALQRGRAVLVGLAIGAICLALDKPTAATLVMLPITAVWLGRQSWPLLRRAGRHGDFSYGVYLWAWPVQQTGVVWLHPDAPLPVLLGVTLVCTFALAFLSWHLVEKPAMRFKPSAPPPSAAEQALAVAPC